jgi:uncharacterized protein involved in type VI secretion and phage assembly
MSGRPDGGVQLYYGLYPAVVTNSTPDAQGRIEIELPWLGKNPSSASGLAGGEEAGQQGDGGELVKLRATLMSVWGSADQGMVAIPAEQSQVIVAFEAGNPMRPYVVGACWNGVAEMPYRGSAASGDNTRATEARRVLRTKAGHYLELDESAGSTKVTLASSNGHKLTLDADGTKVTVENSGGHSITLEADGSIKITANNTVTITAPSGLTVTAPTATFSGLISCTTLTASTSVISPLYSPGVGNLL